MRLFLIRHGEAEKTLPDFGRQLSKQGIKHLKNSFHFIREDVREIDWIISSPLVRAVQTSKILQKFASKDCELIEDFGVSQGSTTEQLIEIGNSINSECIAVVGHMPEVAQHCSEFISSSGVRLSFLPGTIAIIDFNGKLRIGGGVLRALVN